MTNVEILLLAIALSMDALSVSIAGGIQIRKVRISHAFKMAFFFGFFQALMPVLGAIAGTYVKSYITEFDHWIIFAILAFIGGKMIYESKFMKKDEKKKDSDPTRFKILLLLAVATSMDALAVGLSLSFMMVMGSILLTAAFIGTVTFILCFVGVLLGNLAGHFFEDKIEIAGGLILIGVGAKILLEHIVA